MQDTPMYLPMHTAAIRAFHDPFAECERSAPVMLDCTTFSGRTIQLPQPYARESFTQPDFELWLLQNGIVSSWISNSWIDGDVVHMLEATIDVVADAGHIDPEFLEHKYDKLTLIGIPREDGSYKLFDEKEARRYEGDPEHRGVIHVRPIGLVDIDDVAGYIGQWFLMQGFGLYCSSAWLEPGLFRHKTQLPTVRISIASHQLGKHLDQQRKS